MNVMDFQERVRIEQMFDKNREAFRFMYGVLLSAHRREVPIASGDLKVLVQAAVTWSHMDRLAAMSFKSLFNRACLELRLWDGPRDSKDMDNILDLAHVHFWRSLIRPRTFVQLKGRLITVESSGEIGVDHKRLVYVKVDLRHSTKQEFTPIPVTALYPDPAFWREQHEC